MESHLRRNAGEGDQLHSIDFHQLKIENSQFLQVSCADDVLMCTAGSYSATHSHAVSVHSIHTMCGFASRFSPEKSAYIVLLTENQGTQRRFAQAEADDWQDSAAVEHSQGSRWAACALWFPESFVAPCSDRYTT